MLDPCVDADKLEQALEECLDRSQNRSENGGEKAYDRRDDQRETVRIADRKRLWQDFRKDEQQERHQAGGVKNAPITEEHFEHARQERRRANADQRVAEQDRADEPIAPAKQAVDTRGIGVAALLKRVHARPRGCGERRLRTVKKAAIRMQKMTMAPAIQRLSVDISA